MHTNILILSNSPLLILVSLSFLLLLSLPFSQLSVHCALKSPLWQVNPDVLFKKTVAQYPSSLFFTVILWLSFYFSIFLLFSNIIYECMNLDKDSDRNWAPLLCCSQEEWGLIAHGCLCLLNIVLRNDHLKYKCMCVIWIGCVWKSMLSVFMSVLRLDCISQAMCPWALVSFGSLAQGLFLTAMIVLACLLKADRYVITEHFRERLRGREGEFNRPVNTTQYHS